MLHADGRLNHRLISALHVVFWKVTKTKLIQDVNNAADGISNRCDASCITSIFKFRYIKKTHHLFWWWRLGFLLGKSCRTISHYVHLGLICTLIPTFICLSQSGQDLLFLCKNVHWGYLKYVCEGSKVVLASSPGCWAHIRRHTSQRYQMHCSFRGWTDAEQNTRGPNPQQNNV